MSTPNPYDVLGLDRSASADQIKRAYRRLAKEYHPDRNQGDKAAEQRFKQVQAAYDVLGEPTRRAEYDRFGAGGPPPDFSKWSSSTPEGGIHFEHSGFESFGDLGDLIGQFFRRGGDPGGVGVRGARRRTERSRPRPAPGPPRVDATVEITFEEAAHGAKRQFSLVARDGAPPTTLEGSIPAGVEDGQIVRMHGASRAAASASEPFHVRVRVLPHRFFRREGLDVLFDLPLTVPEAVLSARVAIPTLDGEGWLTVQPGTSSGKRLRVRGKGILSARTGQRGDLYAIVQVVVPGEPSRELRELVETHAAAFGTDPCAELTGD